MIAGKMLCKGCGKDVTGGLWAFVLGTRFSLNDKQKAQLDEFKAEFGEEQMVWCWNCMAKLLGVRTLKQIAATEKAESPSTPQSEIKEYANAKKKE